MALMLLRMAAVLGVDVSAMANVMRLADAKLSRPLNEEVDEERI